MISAFMRDIGIFSVRNLVTQFTLVGHIEMLPMGALYMILNGMELAAIFQTN